MTRMRNCLPNKLRDPSFVRLVICLRNTVQVFLAIGACHRNEIQPATEHEMKNSRLVPGAAAVQTISSSSWLELDAGVAC